ncbi:methyltransferase family protein [Paracoccus sanguinis]|uniref:methyltransferase family protein n=1 Tax=Paracoccus sanguinis TaxID=1545044 RepID=UPI000B047830|nr:isoprenylcysteine carboxylmethyltransferase family protein [Paracoccus sanguinis]
MGGLRALDLPPVWLALFALAAWGLGRLAPYTALTPIGWGLVALGAALMIAAAWTMTRRGATLHPGRPPTALVTHGVYARSRNPIYLADAIILAGLCLIWQPLAALVLVPAFAAVITRRFIRREEAWLAARDPDAYAAWAARTRRWL